MAEPISPAGQPTGDDRERVDQPVEAGAAASRSRETPVFLEPPTEEELDRTGEPTADDIHAAAGGARTETASGSDAAVAADTASTRPARTEVVPPVEPRPETDRTAAPTAAQPAVAEPPVAAPDPAAPREAQPVLAPAAEPAPPRRHGNRLAGTAWVLLAAGLFQVLYFGALALIILLLGGAAAVLPGLRNVAAYPFAWLPVLFFFLLFELTVLLFNRAGRFAYVVASLIVGVLVYVLSVLLISILLGGGIGDTATLARAFESPEFILTGLVAREVMLWIGFAIGARGTRVRRRDREARKRYDAEVVDARD